MNPSILIDGGKILVNVRHVNYTFYHSEKKLYQHPWGPLIYIHPENDLHLRTWNYYCELDENLNIVQFAKTDTSTLDKEPLWDFVGLEDARLVRWNGKLYQTGVRRDTTTNGQGRMELSEIQIIDNKVKEVNRYRIEAPNDPDSYCEKNWMPIINKPFHYVKWSNPTEVVEVFLEDETSRTVSLGTHNPQLGDLRGGSQVIPFGNHYIACVHEVDLFNDELGRKDGKYFHRFVVWDENWDVSAYSNKFYFMDGQVEFSVGMAEYGDYYLITFGFADNAAFILRAPKSTVKNFITNKVQ